MPTIEFSPVVSHENIEEISVVAECIAWFNGIFTLEDLEWDDDQLASNYATAQTANGLYEYYIEERNIAVDEAKEQITSDLIKLLTARHNDLGRHSPFSIEIDDTLVLRRKAEKDLTSPGIAYIFMSLFYLYDSENNLISLVGEYDERFYQRQFSRQFAKLFEIISAYALSGRGEIRTQRLGDSRSSKELLVRLAEFAQFCGSGETRTENQLLASQIGANDGGVDVLGIQTLNGIATNDSQIFLVGATIQQDQRRNKIMGDQQIQRFRGFFTTFPNAAVTGVMAVPFPASIAESETCNSANCIYMARNDILARLGTALHNFDSHKPFQTAMHDQLMAIARPLQKALQVRMPTGVISRFELAE